MARSLTVISLLFQSTTYCRYRVYTKFLLTYTAIYRRNRNVLPLGITALQPQSHFHLGTPYISLPNLTIDARSVRVDIVIPQPLYARERALPPFLQKGEWAPEPVWTGKERRIYLFSKSVRTSGRPTRSQSLYRLSYPGPLD